MARPKKQTVDYFPHQCNHKKTMFVLEQRYGNDGYAFWFKLLELLGAAEGHYIDCNDVSTWQFMCAKALMTEDKCREILDYLVCLGAIDAELWDRKIIWVQNFVDGLDDLYSRRKVVKPTKETIGNRIEKDDLVEQKIWCRNATNKAISSGKLIKQPCELCGSTKSVEAHHNDYNNPFEVNWLCGKCHNMHHANKLSGINDNINPQSKVKESKDGGGGNARAREVEPDNNQPDADESPGADIQDRYQDDDVQAVVAMAAKVFGPVSNIYEAQLLVEWTDNFPRDWIQEAVRLTALQKSRSIKYADTILRRWRSSGYEDHEKPWDMERGKARGSGKQPGKTISASPGGRIKKGRVFGGSG